MVGIGPRVMSRAVNSMKLGSAVQRAWIACSLGDEGHCEKNHTQKATNQQTFPLLVVWNSGRSLPAGIGFPHCSG